MAEKRKDSKGRVLRNGESQRKDGKYEYKYTDANGKRHTVYSWKLVVTDRIPSGKRCDEALRDIEKRIEHELECGSNSADKKTFTLNLLFDDFIAHKRCRQSTINTYTSLYNNRIRNAIGDIDVTKLKYSDIKKLYSGFLDGGMKIASVNSINAILSQLFNIIVRDDVIAKNPTEQIISEICKETKVKKGRKKALTIPEQTAFMNFVKESDIYSVHYPMFVFLLGTGCRIGETLGLQWSDCDFGNRIINVERELVYQKQKNGNHERHVTPPKTEKSVRIIPMFTEVRDALMLERKRQSSRTVLRYEVDGYRDFVFTNRNGLPFTPSQVDRILRRIIRRYNKCESANAVNEKCDPLLLPPFSIHCLRHTFCTRFFENESNIKLAQEIMGHSNISTTMNIYTEVTANTKKECFDRLNGKLKIG